MSDRNLVFCASQRLLDDGKNDLFTVGKSHGRGYYWFFGIPVVLDRDMTGKDWFLLDLDKKEETMIELDEEFKGWDYEELATRWGIETDAVALLKSHIMNSLEYTYDDDVECLLPEVKDDMLEFLGKLIASKSEHHYGEYIFVGLLLTAAEDDCTFAQYFCTLLPHMWT